MLYDILKVIAPNSNWVKRRRLEISAADWIGYRNFVKRHWKCNKCNVSLEADRNDINLVIHKCPECGYTETNRDLFGYMFYWPEGEECQKVWRSPERD